MAAEDILGPNLGSLKGKTVRRGGKHVPKGGVKVPRSIMEKHRDVTICVDIMFVNKIPFLVSISHNIKFGTIETIKNRQHKTILLGIKHIKALYAQRGFRVRMAHTDNEFAAMRADLLDMKIDLNVVSKDEHVPEVERYICTIKERTQCVYNTVPFKMMPSQMIVKMVHSSVFWMNMFPPDDGISDTISPRALISGQQMDYARHCQVEFGSYVQTHEDHDNSMQSRTTGAIAL
jgi:hypothetical protein